MKAKGAPCSSVTLCTRNREKRSNEATRRLLTRDTNVVVALPVRLASFQWWYRVADGRCERTCSFLNCWASLACTLRPDGRMPSNRTCCPSKSLIRPPPATGAERLVCLDKFQ